MGGQVQGRRGPVQCGIGHRRARVGAANAEAARLEEGLCDLDALPGESPEPFSALLARSDADAVRAAVARLPLPYRRAVLLRYWRDLAIPEVAAALALPANTVKTHLARARALLRADLNGQAAAAAATRRASLGGSGPARPAAVRPARS